MTSKLSKLKGGWRLLVVLLMVCTLASTLMVTSMATPVLAAHTTAVSVTPDTITMATPQCEVISVKNNAGNAIKKVEITIPQNFAFTSIPAMSGFTISNTSFKVTFTATSSGNYISPGATKLFNLCVRAPLCNYSQFFTKDQCFSITTTDTASAPNNVYTNCAYMQIMDCAPVFVEEEIACTDETFIPICTQIITNSTIDPTTAKLLWSQDQGGNWSSDDLVFDSCTGLWCGNITLKSPKDCTEIWYYKTAADCAGLVGFDPDIAGDNPNLPEGHHSFMHSSSTGPTINSFTNTSPILDIMAGGSTVNVSWNVSAACCPAEGITVDILFKSRGEQGGIQKCLLTGNTSTNVSGYARGTATVTLPMVNTGDSILWIVAHDCCGCNESSLTHIDIPCIQSDLAMFDAITGSGGYGSSGYQNNRYSILVIFNKYLDPATVNASDFTVTNPTATVTSVEVQNVDLWGEVILTLSAPLATDAKPTVNLIGSVSTGSTLGPCQAAECETITGKQVISEDGIAPILTLTTSPANPGYNQLVTVTLTSTENLSLYCSGLCGPDSGNPNIVVRALYYGDNPDPIDDTNDPITMTQNPQNSKMWTGTFINTVKPGGLEWRIEANACQCEDPCDIWPWKLDLCAEASLIFDGFDWTYIQLCEGWNLISVPDTLVEPSIQKAFSLYIYMPNENYGPVTRVNYFTGGTAGTWSCAVLNPISGLWTSTPTSFTQIEPGKAYWVWSDAKDQILMMKLAPRIPSSSLPSISVKVGWNMIGFTTINHYNAALATEYLSSVLTWEKQAQLARYENCGRPGSLFNFGDGWYEEAWWSWNLATTVQEKFGDELGDTPFMYPGAGYWLAVQSDGTIYPPVGYTILHAQNAN